MCLQPTQNRQCYKRAQFVQFIRMEGNLVSFFHPVEQNAKMSHDRGLDFAQLSYPVHVDPFRILVLIFRSTLMKILEG